MIFSQLIRCVRAARQGGAFPPKAFIWLDPGEEPSAKIDAERAAGRIGPATEVCLVTWLDSVEHAAEVPLKQLGETETRDGK